jgi:hypothetical protein
MIGVGYSGAGQDGAGCSNSKDRSPQRNWCDRKTTGETNNNEPTTTRAVGMHHDGAWCSGAGNGAVSSGDKIDKDGDDEPESIQQEGTRGAS